jgi:hypothetical protein
MPNWCANKLIVEHEDDSRIAEFCEAFNESRTCEHYLPMPEKYTSDNNMPDWWSYRVENWGTKWDIGKDSGSVVRDGNRAECVFDSAWSPPIGLYQRLHSLGFKVYATYFEPGCAFGGIWEDGEDYYYEGDICNYPESLIQEYEIDQWFPEEEEAA